MKSRFTRFLVGMVAFTVTFADSAAMASEDRFSEIANQAFVDNSATDESARI